MLKRRIITFSEKPITSLILSLLISNHREMEEYDVIREVEKYGKQDPILSSSSASREDPLERAILDAIVSQMNIKTGPVAPVSASPKQISQPRPRIPDYQTRGPVFTDAQRDDISKLLSSERFYEIEASFGTFRNLSNRSIFSPGLKSFYCFNQIKWFLSNLPRSSMNIQELHQRVDNIEGENIRQILHFDSNDKTWEKKIRIASSTIDNHRWGIRVSQSREESVDDPGFEDMWNAKVLPVLERGFVKESKKKNLKDVAVQRDRRRTRFTETQKKSAFFGVRFDLTIVNELHIREDGMTYSILKYEVEVERTSTSLTIDNFLSAVLSVVDWSQNSQSPSTLIDMKEKKLAVEYHNSLFSVEMSEKKWKNRDPYRLYSGYWNKPKNIKLKDMLEARFDPAVTIKLNGRRGTVMFTRNGTYMYSPPFDIFKVGPPSDSLEGTLIDVEYLWVHDSEERKISVSIHGFDVLFYRGVDVRHSDFAERLKILQSIHDDAPDLYDIEYVTKTYFQEGTFYDRTRKAFQEIENNEYYAAHNLTDGLIFQPGHWYRNNHTFKWKKEEDLTIDFLLIEMDDEEILETIGDEPEYLGRVFWLQVGEKKKLVNFNGTQRHPYRGYCITETGELNGSKLSGTIVECRWDSTQANDFIPIRIRDDRDKPNDYSTARDVWEDIMNPIPRETIEGRSVQLMRKFHNEVKLELLTREFREGETIVDIGSGQGGDLFKWDRVKLKKVYAVEPDPEKIKELEARRISSNIRTSITVIPTGAENHSLIESAVTKGGDELDGITAFFSLTFFPESKSKYAGLLETMDLIPPHGKLVGIVLDGDKVYSLLQNIRKEQNLKDDEPAVFENSACTITQVSDFDENMTGNEITISIHDVNRRVFDQTEWLFFYDRFEEDMRKEFGFRLRHLGYLDKGPVYDRLPSDSQFLSGLFRAFVLQKSDPTRRKPRSYQRRKKSSKKSTEESSEAASSEGSSASTAPPSQMVLCGREAYPLPNSYDLKLYRVAFTEDSDIVRAVLEASYSEYCSGDEKSKEKYLRRLKKSIEQTLDLKVFQELDGGRVFDSEMQRLESSSSSGKKSKKKNRTRVTDQAYQNYLSRALSFTVGLKEMIEILSRSLSIDIYILKQIRGGVSPIASLCVLTEGNQVAIVLYSDSKVSKDPNDLKISKVYTDPQNFSPVSNGTETTFSFDSSLIQKLQSQIE